MSPFATRKDTINLDCGNSLPLSLAAHGIRLRTMTTHNVEWKAAMNRRRPKGKSPIMEVSFGAAKGDIEMRASQQGLQFKRRCLRKSILETNVLVPLADRQECPSSKTPCLRTPSNRVRRPILVVPFCRFVISMPDSMSVPGLCPHSHGLPPRFETRDPHGT